MRLRDVMADTALPRGPIARPAVSNPRLLHGVAADNRLTRKEGRFRVPYVETAGDQSGSSAEHSADFRSGPDPDIAPLRALLFTPNRARSISGSARRATSAAGTAPSSCDWRWRACVAKRFVACHPRGASLSLRH